LVPIRPTQALDAATAPDEHENRIMFKLAEPHDLVQAVRRTLERFPEDFMFRLTPDEKAEVVANCDHLSRLKFSPALPHAFTEHGAIMAASVLNTPRAIEASIFVVRAFVRLREMLAAHKELARRLTELEVRLVFLLYALCSMLYARPKAFIGRRGK
jgi:hypothetical protein